MRLTYWQLSLYTVSGRYCLQARYGQGMAEYKLSIVSWLMLLIMILSDREFTLEFGLLLSVIYCPVIQHALVTPEVYSTLVADTE